VRSHVTIGGESCPVSSELFAITADAHLLRGSLSPEQCTCTFPDGRGTSLAEVRSRLARVVCADPEQLAAGDLEEVAAAVEQAQVASIAAALRRVAGGLSAGTEVVAVGVGAFLARAAAARCGLPVRPDAALPCSLSPLVGHGAEVAPAVALSVLGRG
jgi:(4-(4-[2-(gamma-L-glutamylamino)ethyl]phenoxymethyl)furan-2-yl)methanamine synthase